MSRTQRRELPDAGPALVQLLLAVDPAGLGGVVLRGMPGPARTQWLDGFRRLLPAGAPWCKVPVSVSDDRLLGGLDFAATVEHGRPIVATGLIEAADGGALLLSMAERMAATSAAVIAAALDRGSLRIERDGVTRECTTRFAVVAFDESLDDEEGLAEGLADRLAFSLSLSGSSTGDVGGDAWNAADMDAARARLGNVPWDDAVARELCQAAAAFGVTSARAELLMLRAARAAAALRGKRRIDADEIALAARLVLPQRARCLPEPANADAAPPPEAEQTSDANDATSGDPEDRIVDAVRAAIPAGLLKLLEESLPRQRRASAGGRGGPRTRARRRGRPVGVVAGDAGRLNVLATLKEAAPWQTLRRASAASPASRRPLHVRKTDLRITRFEDRTETTTIFTVDASGSQAAQRLAEVKGAIELLLNDCYVRRDQVALIAFRGEEAAVLLPPTRALARAKRSLAALPGGGATPLASGIDAARALAESVVRQGRRPAIVLLTDGRANVARNRATGGEPAGQDALASGRELAATGFRALLVDTSRRPRARARELADAMRAHYVPLPHADAAAISAAVQDNTP